MQVQLACRGVDVSGLFDVGKRQFFEISGLTIGVPQWHQHFVGEILAGWTLGNLLDCGVNPQVVVGIHSGCVGYPSQGQRNSSLAIAT